MADTYFDVGDTKNITLSTNEVLTVQIYGFNHDDKSGGSGRVGITFGTKDLMVTTRQMNAIIDNNDSWRSSAMRMWMNNTLVSQLPTELQNSLRLINKSTARGGMNTLMLVTSDSFCV